MDDQTATLRATIDNSGTKPQLVIEGTVMVYASDYNIESEVAVPQGINETICLVNAVIHERQSPMKGTMRPFGLPPTPYKEPWQSVQVNFQYEPSDGNEGRIQSITADIEGL